MFVRDTVLSTQHPFRRLYPDDQAFVRSADFHGGRNASTRANLRRARVPQQELQAAERLLPKAL